MLSSNNPPLKKYPQDALHGMNYSIHDSRTTVMSQPHVSLHGKTFTSNSDLCILFLRRPRWTTDVGVFGRDRANT